MDVNKRILRYLCHPAETRGPSPLCFPFHIDSADTEKGQKKKLIN